MHHLCPPSAAWFRGCALLSSSAVQFLPVELGSPAVVLLLRVLGVAVVASKEGESLGVASKLHLAQLLPCPIRVKVSGSDKCQMDAKGSVDAATVDADEDSVRD